MRQLLAIACMIGVGVSTPVGAATDPLIEGAKLCTKHLPRYEREYGIPTHLLSAIASTESGRYHENLKIRIPWPWTINVDGKGYYYETKQAALDAAKKFRSRGIKSMDVGCMQVNMQHHPHAFASIDQAFEPEKNIAYAASFLRTLYEEGKSWKSAAGDYHSKTPSRGNQYVGRVYDSWYQIIDKLRQARMQVPEASVAMVGDRSVAKPVSAKTNPSRLPEQVGKKVADYKSPRMNSIQVANTETRKKENGVIVIRPEIKVVDSQPTVTVQKSSEKPTFAIAQANTHSLAGSGKIISATQGAKKSGPNFIFND